VDRYDLYMTSLREQKDDAQRRLLARVFLNQLHDPKTYPVELPEILSIVDETVVDQVFAFMTFCAARLAGARNGVPVESADASNAPFGADQIRHQIYLSEAQRFVLEHRP